MTEFDFLVVGAGIAGASVAAHLAARHKVALVDMEERAGYHSTSRSAASFEPNYGPPAILAVTRASAAFFANPPSGFAEAAVFNPRGTLLLEAEGQEDGTAKLLSNAAALEEIGEARARAMFPLLRQGYARRSFLDANTADLDVDLIHRGYLAMLKQAGGVVNLSSPLTAASSTNSAWTVTCGPNMLKARVIINAAGAWGDVVARACGVKPVGLQPKRRSIAVVPLPGAQAVNNWPMTIDVAETWYAKPQSGKLLVSSADATPVDPHDAYADDMALAVGIDRLMQATTLEVDRVEHSWGGLRTFAPDGSPVVGYDPDVPGFFWLVGQGGYGIQSAPALSETAAALAMGKPVPSYVQDHALDLNDVSPARFVK